MKRRISRALFLLATFFAAYSSFAEDALPENVKTLIQANEELPDAVKAAVADAIEPTGVVDGWTFSVSRGIVPSEESKIRREQKKRVVVEETTIQATTRLALRPEFAEIYRSAKLDSEKTLATAVESIAHRLANYYLDDATLQIVVQADDDLTLIVCGKTEEIAQVLGGKNALQETRQAYADLLRRRALIATQAAAETFKQARERDLASPQFYLDAALCQAILRRDDEARKLVVEALDKFGESASQEFRKRAENILRLVGDEDGQKIADEPARQDNETQEQKEKAQNE